MGKKLSKLRARVGHRGSLKQLQQPSSASNQQNDINLQEQISRCIHQFDIWTAAHHGQDLLLIWVDEQADTDLENASQMKILLNKISEATLTFTDSNQFIEFIATLTNETVFLILSGRVSLKVLSLIHDKKQIHSIYIFCMESDNYRHLLNHHSKVRNVHNNHVKLILEVQKDVHIYMKQCMTFATINKNDQNSITNLSVESALFLWSYVIKEILIRTEKTNHEKEAMIAYCRLEYQFNTSMLEDIDEFERTYQSSDAIEWYTRDSFVYRLVNKFIRTENIGALLQLKYFITDLSHCLMLKWEEDYRNRGCETIKIYRGAALTVVEMEKLIPGALVSPNGYFSTSESLETALVFAENVLFEIDVNLPIENLIFASVAEYSQYPQEQEVLFDIASTFKIVDVYFNDEIGKTYVKMIATNENDDTAIGFITNINIRKKTNRYFDGLINDFVHKVGYERGLRLYEYFLKCSPADIEKIINGCTRFLNLYEKHVDASNSAILYGCLGWFFTQRSEYDTAILYCNKALSSIGERPPNDNMSVEIAMIYNTIGWSYYEKGDYTMALKWCLKAKQIFQDCTYAEDSKYVRVLRAEQHLISSPARNNAEYAEVLTNIGCIYYKTHEFDLAIFYCKTSMNILELCNQEFAFDVQREVVAASRFEIDNHHETIAVNYEVFADVEYQRQNYDRALEYYKKALDIFEKVSPRIPICLQRSPLIFGRNLRRLQYSIRATELNLIDRS